MTEKDNFPEASGEAIYDAFFPDIHSWLEDRRSRDPDFWRDSYESHAKQPTVPFAPLTRELGVSFISTEDYKPLTLTRQRVIFNWVESVEERYDLIQRAEGQGNPFKAYNGAKKRFLEHAETPNSRTTIAEADASGRAAVHRHYETTLFHHDIAERRLAKGQKALRTIKKDGELTDEQKTALDEILQELANGVAANRDNQFPGGDLSARVAGNSILRIKDKLVAGDMVDVNDYMTLLAAGLNYVRGQVISWKKALNEIVDYASKNHIELAKKKES